MVLGGYLAGYRYSTLPVPTRSPIPRVHPLLTVTAVHGPGMQSARLNMVVGLISVHQLTLSAHFSGSQGITEVYNLLRIGRITNHSFIPGTK